MNYTITPDGNRYKIITTLYQSEEAKFVDMLMQYNKISGYAYFKNEELLAKLSYMHVRNDLKDDMTVITGTIYLKEIDAKLIEQAIKEIKSYIDSKVLYYRDIFSAIDMYIKHRQPFRQIEAKITDVKNVVGLHKELLESLLNQQGNSKDEDSSIPEEINKQSLLQKLKVWKLKGGGKDVG